MPALKIKFSIVVLSFLFFFCANVAQSQNPVQVVSGHPRMLITPSILTTLRARVTPVADGGLGTHTATYTALKAWCDTNWGNTAYENEFFGPSDRYYDAGMMRYALIYVLGQITNTASPYDYTTHTINDYGNKARDIMLRLAPPPGDQELLEYISFTYDWVSMASPTDGSYRMSDAQKQIVVSYFYYWGGNPPNPPLYTGYMGLFVAASVYGGLAFYGDGVGGTYGTLTADHLAQVYVNYISDYLLLAVPITQESYLGGGNRNGPCYTNYTGNDQPNIGSTTVLMYVLTTATNLTASQTYNYYTSFMDTPIWFIYESQPGPAHYSPWGSSSDIPLALWDDCAFEVPNVTSVGNTTMKFKLSAMLYGLVGNTTYQQLIYWYLNTKLGVTTEDTTFDVLFNPRTVPTTFPSSVAPVKAFGWNSNTGTIGNFNSLKAGIGEVHYESTLNFDLNTTVGIFRASPQFYSGDHNHFDSLAFYIFKGESLALPNSGKYFPLYEGSGFYGICTNNNNITCNVDSDCSSVGGTCYGPVGGFPHVWLYYRRNVSTNSLLIMDPTDVEFVPWGGYYWTWRDGGQQVVTGDWGGLTKHEDSSDYAYTSADATVAYSNKADLVQRDFVYLKGTSSITGDRDYFVVFDRVTSKVATNKKVFLLHSIGEPSLDQTGTWTFGTSSGGLYTANNVSSITIPMTTSKLLVKSLLPATNTTYKYGGTATTTLAQDLTATDSGLPMDINVASSANFSPNPTVRIDNEAFVCGGKATGKLTGCMRGPHYWRFNDLTTHSAGATVLQEFPWMFREVDTGKWVNYPHDFGGGHDPEYGYTLDECGKWGIRIENGADELSTNFLTVMHPTKEMSRAMPTTTLITSGSGNMSGALIADTIPRIVMFAQTTALVSDVTYTASYSQSLTGKHLITGLVPFDGYDIYKNGSKIGSKTASSQGIIYFESTGGSTFGLVQTSGSIPPPSDTTPPSAPTNLTAVVISSSQINLSWTASIDNVGVTGYRIYRNGSQIATSATNSYSDIGLSASTTYSYTVSAYDAAGNNSAQSSVVSVATLASNPVWMFCANEGGQCNFTGTKQVRYGANGQYVSLTLTNGSVCSNAVFGDPIYGVVKHCDYLDTAIPPPTQPPPSSPSGYVINDFTLHPSPNIPRPAKGVPFLDPVYHSKITRISDAPTDIPGTYNIVSSGYPKFDCENADGTKLLLQSWAGTGWNIWNANPPYNLIKQVNYGGFGETIDARWDKTDPDVFYYTHTTFNKYTVSTDTITVLHDFRVDYPPTHGVCNANYSVSCTTDADCSGAGGTCLHVPSCGNSLSEEGDSSNDSRYWTFAIPCWDPISSPMLPNNATYTAAVVKYDKDFYSKDNGKIISTIPRSDTGWATACLGIYPMDMCFNSTSSSPSGNYSLIDGDDVEYILPASFSHLTDMRVINCTQHANWALDADGNEVMVCAETHTTDGVEKLWAKMVDIATGTEYWLAPLGNPDYSSNMWARYHVSGMSRDKNGWAVFSVWGPNYTDVPNTPTDWTGHSVFMVELTRNITTPSLTNHARIWMLAQTHTVYKAYGENPFGKINKKGTKVWFGSGWDTSFSDPGGQYDVYQIDLPAAWYQDLMGFNILTSSLIAGTMSLSYSQTLQASGEATPYTWSLLSGSLPPGLSLNASTGVISGTPTVAGTSNFTIQVKDSSSPAQTSSKAFSVTVNSTAILPAPPTGLKIAN